MSAEDCSIRTPADALADDSAQLAPLVAKEEIEVIDTTHLPGPIWDDVAPKSVQQRVVAKRPAAAEPTKSARRTP